MNKLYVNIFCKIIIHEIRIDYTSSKQWIINLNLQFVKKISKVLTKDIKNQQTHDHIFCLKSILKHIIIFFFKLTLKFNNKWQKIHHLFHSFKKSVNDNIPKTFEMIKYMTVNKTIEKISNLRSETMLIKRNLANAFRHVFIAKANWWLLEFKWQKQCWINQFLFFELKTFPFLFDLFVKNINWIICKKKMTLHSLFEWFSSFYFFEKWLSSVWGIFREPMQTIKHQHQNWKKFRRTYRNFLEHWIKHRQYNCSSVRW